jgi:hypothetical protein
MLAVSTAPIKGASAGGSGAAGLWSYHRPFAPLSVVEGHKDGAVTDFTGWIRHNRCSWYMRPQLGRLAPETVGCSGCQAPVDKAPSHEVDAIHTITVNRTCGGVDRTGWDLAAHD